MNNGEDIQNQVETPDAEEESIFNEAKGLSLQKTKEFIDSRYAYADEKPYDAESIVENTVRKLQEEGKSKKEIAEYLKGHADEYSQLQEVLSFYENETSQIVSKEFEKKMKEEFGGKSDLILSKANEFLKKNVGHELNDFSFKSAKQKLDMVNKLYNEGKIFLEKPVKVGATAQEKSESTFPPEEQKRINRLLANFTSK